MKKNYQQYINRMMVVCHGVRRLITVYRMSNRLIQLATRYVVPLLPDDIQPTAKLVLLTCALIAVLTVSVKTIMRKD